LTCNHRSGSSFVKEINKISSIDGGAIQGIQGRKLIPGIDLGVYSQPSRVSGKLLYSDVWLFVVEFLA
jgi:hypothetical protein